MPKKNDVPQSRFYTFRIDNETREIMASKSKNDNFNWSEYIKNCVKQKLQEGVKNDNKK